MAALLVSAMPAAAVPATASAGEYSISPAWDHITDSFGILYFYRPTCPYCREQDVVLQRLTAKGWKNLKKVDVTQSPQTAAEYSVKTVPALWLIGYAEGEIRRAHISLGLITEDELLRSIDELYAAWFGPAI
jgi:thiol-disulfide isomerase/thioredoxin